MRHAIEILLELKLNFYTNLNLEFQDTFYEWEKKERRKKKKPCKMQTISGPEESFIASTVI
jgi:hypothetical protein